MSEYRDVQTAVRVEKFRIWFAWVCGGFIMLVIAYATRDIAVVSVITQVMFLAGGVAFTVTAVRMTNALNRKAEAKRREILGDV